MRTFILLVAVILVATSCGESATQTESTPTTISCTFGSSDPDIDVDMCLEALNGNPADLKKSCTSPNVYADSACSVPQETPGCRYTNKQGVQITNWYHGSDWEEASIDEDCDELDGERLTK